MSILYIFLWILALIFLLGALDDLLIDVLSFLRRKRLWKPQASEWIRIQNQSEQAIAVMIPAWREHAVLRAMVDSNLRRLKYSNYRWFIGVYPNDEATLQVARQLELEFPEKVTVVVTDRDGPTSKAHCLNCIVQAIEKSSRPISPTELVWTPVYAVIHDAEDVIDADSFKMINALPEGEYDFVQVPVLSMPVSAKKWVAGTYMDEFADVHLRELPAREFLKMPIPSAGVGTFFQWDALIEHSDRMGYAFDENNLTEDYEISLRMARLGAKQKFLLAATPEGRIIATREFFPDSLGTSIRQKTRWTTGIALQTREKWGLYGVGSSLLEHLAFRYALWRDRKSLWSNPLTLLGLVVLLGLWGASYTSFELHPTQEASFYFSSLIFTNLSLLVLRLYQRFRFSKQAYSLSVGILSIPRYFVSTVINGIVALRAVKQFYFGKKVKAQGPQGNRKMEWDKTEHFFPTQEEIDGLNKPSKDRVKEI
jgi:bacteriophage N4 adsorption protein B